MPVAVVTGGTDGIGREVAHALAARRYEVIVVGRDRKKGAACIAQIQRNVVGVRAVFMRADLSLVREADRLAEAIALVEAGSVRRGGQ
jgi:short-subunit dehydrogenase